MKYPTIRQNLFYAVSLMTISFIVILTIIISSIYYFKFFDYEIESSFSKLSLISNQLSNYLQVTENYSKTIMTAPVVQQKIKTYNISKQSLNALDQVEIKTEINHIIQSSKIIKNVAIYAKDGTKIISTTSSSPELSKVYDHAMPVTLTWLPKFNSSTDGNEQALSAIACIRPFYDISSGKLIGYLELSIPKEVIYSIYKHATHYQNKLYITNEYGVRMILTDTDRECSLPTEIFKSAKVYLQSYTFTLRSIFFIKQFKDLNWYFVYEVNAIHFIKPTLTTLTFIFFITLLGVLMSLFLAKNLSNKITKPVYKLMAHTKKVKSGDWATFNEPTYDRDINRLFQEFNTMIIAQKKLRSKLITSEQNKTKISLELLQQQIKPHFLYNTLDNICALAEIEEKEVLVDLVMNLSAFYRQSLNDGISVITIKKELDITRAYLNIMQIRQFDKLDFCIHCPEALYDIPCLKLLLQPLVENSIYHGIKHIDEKGKITIDIFEQTNEVYLSVTDNGKGMDKNDFDNFGKNKKSGFGLFSIQQRIQLHYGNQYGIALDNTPLNGCRILIRLPKR